MAFGSFSASAEKTDSLSAIFRSDDQAVNADLKITIGAELFWVRPVVSEEVGARRFSPDSMPHENVSDSFVQKAVAKLLPAEVLLVT